MVAQAREQGLALTGPDGLLKLFTQTVLETALNEQMTEHLGYEKNGAGRDRASANIGNGCRSKTVLSDAVGEVEIAVPRDRQGTFSPAIVKKRQRRLGDVDEVVLSLYAKGLTTGEISAHFHDIYGASVSTETVSRITDAVIADMEEGSHRPLDPVYVAMVIDAIVVTVREGQVANRPVYAVIGVTLEGRTDVLGLTMGTGGGQGAKFVDERACGLEKSRRTGCVLPRLRWSQRFTRGRGERLATHDCANMCHSFDPQLVPPGAPETVGCAAEGSETHLHGTQSGRRGHRAGRTRRKNGAGNTVR